MNSLKAFLADFPNQNGGVVTALLLILLTGLVVVVRLALGQNFPDGYDTWIWALVALSGVTTVGMIGKRATDIDLAKAKNPVPPSAVTAEAGSTVQVAAAAPVPAAPAQPPPIAPTGRDD